MTVTRNYSLITLTVALLILPSAWQWPINQFIWGTVPLIWQSR